MLLINRVSINAVITGSSQTAYHLYLFSCLHDQGSMRDWKLCKKNALQWESGDLEPAGHSLDT
jgi:hypothetical protein